MSTPRRVLPASGRVLTFRGQVWNSNLTQQFNSFRQTPIYTWILSRLVSWIRKKIKQTARGNILILITFCVSLAIFVYN